MILCVTRVIQKYKTSAALLYYNKAESIVAKINIWKHKVIKENIVNGEFGRAW